MNDPNRNECSYSEKPNSSDIISRRKAFEYFVTLWECIGTIMDRDEWEDVCMTTANEIPSAQQERPKGNWVEIGDEPYDEWECDVCGFVIDGSGCIDPEEYRDVYKFCPNCGAYMRGEMDAGNKNNGNEQNAGKL